MRQADVYVFCVQNCKEQKLVNPLDLAQWDFYPITTEALNAAVSNQKSIGLNTLLALGVKKCSFTELQRHSNFIGYRRRFTDNNRPIKRFGGTLWLFKLL